MFFIETNCTILNELYKSLFSSKKISFYVNQLINSWLHLKDIQSRKKIFNYIAHLENFFDVVSLLCLNNMFVIFLLFIQFSPMVKHYFSVNNSFSN